MSEHTPGPWDVKTREQWEGGYDFFSGPDGAFTFMADVEPEDATLIAAAPDLLAALELVRSIIVEGAAVGFNPLDGGDWAERLYRSQSTTAAAVKKAGGDVRAKAEGTTP